MIYKYSVRNFLYHSCCSDDHWYNFSFLRFPKTRMMKSASSFGSNVEGTMRYSPGGSRCREHTSRMLMKTSERAAEAWWSKNDWFSFTCGVPMSWGYDNKTKEFQERNKDYRWYKIYNTGTLDKVQITVLNCMNENKTSEILQYSACGEANEYTHVKICNLCFSVEKQLKSILNIWNVKILLLLW